MFGAGSWRGESVWLCWRTWHVGGEQEGGWGVMQEAISLPTRQYLVGPSRPAGATFNMADWPPSTTIEMNLLAFNLEDDHIWEGSRWVEFEKIRPEAKNWKTTIARGGAACYNLLQLGTTCDNWPKPAAPLATTQLQLLVWRELVELRLPMEDSGYPGRYSFLNLRCFVWRVFIYFWGEFCGKYLHRGQKL